MWIEILDQWRVIRSDRVTPYAGVWIEIRNIWTDPATNTSHSLRGSVDWNHTFICIICSIIVTPYAGVWIEIMSNRVLCSVSSVTPYAGVWIEISKNKPWYFIFTVTPYAGVWIEIKTGAYIEDGRERHSLRGSVDWNMMHALVALMTWSLPTRECGLKWTVCWRARHIKRHSLRGSVDWNWQDWWIDQRR